MTLGLSISAGVHTPVGGAATLSSDTHSRVGTDHHCSRATRVARAATRVIAGLAALAFVSVAISFAVSPLLLPAFGCALIALTLKGCSCHSPLARRVHIRRRAPLPWYSRMYNRLPTFRTRRTQPLRQTRVRHTRRAASPGVAAAFGSHVPVGGARRAAGPFATRRGHAPVGGVRVLPSTSSRWGSATRSASVGRRPPHPMHTSLR